MTDWPANLNKIKVLLEDNYNIKLLYDDLLDQADVIKNFPPDTFKFVVMILCYHYPNAESILKVRFDQGKIKTILDNSDYSSVVKIQQLIDQSHE